MLTYTALVELERRLHSTRLLSVFLEQAPADPATRHGWRVRVDHAISDVRTTYEGAPRGEREALDRALAGLEREIAQMGGTVEAHGWVGYIEAEHVCLAASLPIRTPTLISWGRGIRIAPLLSALKEERPAIVAIVDSRQADI